MSNSSTESRSRAWVDVDLGALRRNLLRVRDAAPGAALVPMVKADAYGLGAAAVVPACVEALAPHELWGFGVAAVAEGEALRAGGWQGRVLVCAPPPPGEYARAARVGLTPALSDVEAVARWAAEARSVGRPLAFHLEVDTGMGRAGLPWDEAAQWGGPVAAAAADLLAWEGCFTHFHSADEPDLAPTDGQEARFRAAVAALPPAPSGTGRLLHSANSAASIRRGGYGLDLVRPGIFLYGGRAGPGEAPEAVAAVRARLARVRRVPSGSTVGYGATHTALGPEVWGTAAIGYGDGLRRALATAGGEAIVRGRRVPIVGRISMDVTVLDLTAVPGAEPGDVATFVGADGGQEITADEVAARCGTISYEVLTGLGTRLPRVYTGAADPAP
ncbi:MAG TPA: alanine racemase [Longimicrobiaceae bacterium]|nr:alanine racemase [Longimicrobiaceae bacterium]